jgi:hypothetical protein
VWSLPPIKSGSRDLANALGRCYDVYGPSLFAFVKEAKLIGPNSLRSPFSLAFPENLEHLGCDQDNALAARPWITSRPLRCLSVPSKSSWTMSGWLRNGTFVSRKSPR